MASEERIFNWKTPDEVMRLHKLKQKQKALHARINKPPNHQSQSETRDDGLVPESIKRKNPFARHRIDQVLKKPKLDRCTVHDSNDDSLFKLLSENVCNKNGDNNFTGTVRNNPQHPQSFSNIFSTNGDNDNEVIDQTPTAFVPVDWSIQTRLRLLSATQIPGHCLKTSQEASGITSFVRCLNNSHGTDTSLDISPGAQFHQISMYWQHPHLPWLTLFPRSSKMNNGFVLGDQERVALAKDWTNSFRALFQLLRARQCPYFYLCANTFTILFRAAGIGGRVETHALLTPTSRGMRAALKQEDVEFTMPLKKTADPLNKSSDDSNSQNQTSFSNHSHDVSLNEGNEANNSDESDDDGDHERWLSSLGVDASEIKRINTVQARKQKKEEATEDFCDNSLVLIEGVECQAFFNFLLNAKSTIPNVGRLAGVPPTLLAPVAFPGACLRNLQVKTSKIRLENVDYHSIELRGAVLPHVLQYLCRLLKESKDTFSATMAACPSTRALSKAAQKLIEDQNKENNITSTDVVFGRENLSDCGLSPDILEALCRVGTDAVRNLERMCYNKEHGGFTWS